MAAVTNRVSGFGVPLGVPSTFCSPMRARLQPARLTGRPQLPGVLWAMGTVSFPCWYPFHLLLWLELVGMQKPRLDVVKVWLWPGPLLLLRVRV